MSSKTSKKMYYIDLLKKTYDPEYSGEWLGASTHLDIFLNMYLQKKYKKDLYSMNYVGLLCYYYPDKAPHQVALNDMKNNLRIKITKKSVQNELLPYIEKYRKSKKRFHFFHIVMYTRDKNTGKIVGHSTSALYDSDSKSDKKTIDFFNNIQYGNTNLKAYDRQFKTFFGAIYGKDISLNYSYECNRFGDFDQHCMENFNPKANPKFKNYIGPCLIWTLWFLDTRLKNTHLSREQVIKFALGIFLKEKELVCKILIDYAIFVDKFVKQYTIDIQQSKKKVNIRRKVTEESKYKTK